MTIVATGESGDNGDSGGGPIILTAGQWYGSPGDLTVDFVVASGGAGLEEIRIKFTDFSCGGTISNGSVTFSSSIPYPITDSSFEESLALNGNKTVTIKGIFNSSQSASGTYEAVFYGDTCTGTWDAAPESGAACAPPTYDATGTWSAVETETYNSDGEPLEVNHGTATISQTNSSFTLETDDGETFDGTVCGTVYTFSGSWEMQEPGGQWGTAIMEGSVELTSETNFEGNYTFTWTNGTYIYSEKWDVVGTKQAGCVEGLPLTISDLSFPTTVTGGSSYDGSVAYQGSFEDIANPRMFLKIPFSGGIALTSVASAPTASNCRIHFKGIIPDDLIRYWFHVF
jgi:hypothetical protein